MYMTNGQAAEFMGAAAHYIGKALNKLETVINAREFNPEETVPIVHEMEKLLAVYDTIGDMANKLMREYKESKKSA